MDLASIIDGCLLLFFSCIVSICLRYASNLFLPSYARRHRVLGVTYITWMLFGILLNMYHVQITEDGRGAVKTNSTSSNSTVHTSQLSNTMFSVMIIKKITSAVVGDNNKIPPLFLFDANRYATAFFTYDVVLGCLGIALTLSAAFDFESAHKHVRNKASGALEQNTTITFSEMIEHAFYQILNLLQISFFHLLAMEPFAWSLRLRLLLFVAVTLPWGIRSWFPVNHFSANYSKAAVVMKRSSGEETTATENSGNNRYTLFSMTFEQFLYFIKKWQYVFYKQFLLHGLNMTVAFSGVFLPTHHHHHHHHDNHESSAPSSPSSLSSPRPLASTNHFRRYWIVLNAAYTFEFFLQTLVKKGYLRQSKMLLLNVFLMVVGSAGAIVTLSQSVDFLLAATSLLMNFAFRGHELCNVFGTAITGLLLRLVTARL